MTHQIYPQWMRGKIFNWVSNLWPERVKVSISPGDEWYRTIYLNLFLHEIEVTPKSVFEVGVNYDLLGFEQEEVDIWRVVFAVRENISLTIVSGGVRKTVPVKSLGKLLCSFLLLATETTSTLKFRIPPVEMATALIGLEGRKTAIEYWRLVGDPTG